MADTARQKMATDLNLSETAFIEPVRGVAQASLGIQRLAAVLLASAMLLTFSTAGLCTNHHLDSRYHSYSHLLASALLSCVTAASHRHSCVVPVSCSCSLMPRKGQESSSSRTPSNCAGSHQLSRCRYVDMLLWLQQQ